MPLKDTYCPSCGQTSFDLLVAQNEPAKCPNCESDEAQYLLSFAADYQIKGDNSASVRPKKSRSTE